VLLLKENSSYLKKRGAIPPGDALNGAGLTRRGVVALGTPDKAPYPACAIVTPFALHGSLCD
jgi:hypothetical protein